MEVFDRAALGDGEAVEMHEAGHVAADEDVGVGGEDVVEFERTHAAGNVREGDGKGAAEAATLLVLAEGGNDGVFDGAEELERGLAAASAAAVAGTVEGDAGRLSEFSRPRLDAEAVENEVHDFPCPAGE